MANINFSKLNCKINIEIKIVQFNENKIEVKCYLPIQEKNKFIEEVINNSITEYNYANPMQVRLFTVLGFLKYYTNIKFTEKQLSDPVKLFDLVISSGLFETVYNEILEEEKDFISTNIDKSITAFYKYRTSLLGMIDILKLDYSDLNAQLSSILAQVNDPGALTLIKQLGGLMGSNQDNKTQ